MSIPFCQNDGGRAAAGHKGTARDCVARAIAIASGEPYDKVAAALAAGNASERKTKRSHKSSGKATADHGIATRRKWFQDYMTRLRFVWVPTMAVGTGCKVHLRADELPETGRLIVSLSKHFAAVIDGVLHDTHDSSRNGTRCVYGYWVYVGSAKKPAAPCPHLTKAFSDLGISSQSQP